MREFFPGIVVIGSDGGGELLALDTRGTDHSPVVMVPGISTGWNDGLLQAPNFSDFMAQRERGTDLRWDEPYDGKH